MNWEVFITCAVTGSGDTASKSDHVPITPEQVAGAAIEAAKAGAAVAMKRELDTRISVRACSAGMGYRRVM